MSLKPILKKYLKEVARTYLQGDAREETFYPALKTMLEEAAKALGFPDVIITVLPRPTDAGNPDFRATSDAKRARGYIEAKKPNEERLDYIENTEQLKRYRSSFSSHPLILTNFLEFRFYRKGQHQKTVMVGRPAILEKVSATPPVENAEGFEQCLIEFFFNELKAHCITEAEPLAIELAKHTRFFRDVIAEQFAQDGAVESPATKLLAGFFNTFKGCLIGTLTHGQFADFFAQTVAYGLFAARIRFEGEAATFKRKGAREGIPPSIGILRDLFRWISDDKLPEEIAWRVDDIAQILANSDAPGILRRYSGEGRDPLIHFYETFLAKYDPDVKERRGVYYTPEPVVGYIVRSLNAILKTHFAKGSGLASDGVTLLDPAAGTMTFVARAVKQAVAENDAHFPGDRKGFIKGKILKNFYAFELLMSPYAIGHLKMGVVLEKLGYHLAEEERMPFYLTNTLDDEELKQIQMPYFSSLAEESAKAAEVKQKTPILVILGNPPYLGNSANPSQKPVVIAKGQEYVAGWTVNTQGKVVPVTKTAKREPKNGRMRMQPTFIGGLVRDYFFIDGKPLNDTTKWLHNDYVKFLRFAQWKIEQAGSGVVGMITSHSYLDNPTFRGMRQSLLKTFDEIYVLDLHGNSLKKETCPDGSKDENVFDIQQGVCIAFFVKRNGGGKGAAAVRHADLHGLRQGKYDWLDAHDIESTPWKELAPASPSCLFVPRDATQGERFQSFPSVPDIFPVNSVGIVTARDKLTIHWTPKEVWDTVVPFSKMEPELAREGYGLGKDVGDWKVALAQKDLKDSGLTRDYVKPVLYRPFDVRYTYFTGRSRGFHCRPRSEVMRHMLVGTNLGLITVRRVPLNKPACFFMATKLPMSNGAIRSDNQSIDTLFPLYLYPTANKDDLFAPHAPEEREANLNPEIVALLAQAYGGAPSPEDVFRYVYAVLYAPAYREKYAEFLRGEFPRVPFAADADLFGRMAAVGRRLAALHLLKSSELDPPACKFPKSGDGRVEKGKKGGLRYETEKQSVFINAEQHFAPVPQEVWEFHVGGYQVCHKWLKDRTGRVLSSDEIRTYCRIVTALGKTIEIQRELDGLYPEVEENLLEVRCS